MKREELKTQKVGIPPHDESKEEVLRKEGCRGKETRTHRSV